MIATTTNIHKNITIIHPALLTNTVEERQDSVELFLGDVDEMDFEDIKKFFKENLYFLINIIVCIANVMKEYTELIFNYICVFSTIHPCLFLCCRPVVNITIYLYYF